MLKDCPLSAVRELNVFAVTFHIFCIRNLRTRLAVVIRTLLI